MSFYIKKLFVLKQVKQGFTTDGKTLSGMVCLEKYCDSLTITLSLINLAPISLGQFFIYFADEFNNYEYIPVSLFNDKIKVESKLDLSGSLFCALCFVKESPSIIAISKIGEKTFDIQKVVDKIIKLNKVDAFIIKESEKNNSTYNITEKEVLSKNKNAENDGLLKDVDQKVKDKSQTLPPYDDEVVATENYFLFEENNNGKEGHGKISDDANAENAGKRKKIGEEESLFTKIIVDDKDTSAVDGERTYDKFSTYYDAVKEELFELFETYPKEETLTKNISDSKWVKVTYTDDRHYIVGIINQNNKPKYICYGLPCKKDDKPPEPIEEFCGYIPLSLFNNNNGGYWIIYQDAITGDCLKKSSI